MTERLTGPLPMSQVQRILDTVALVGFLWIQSIRFTRRARSTSNLSEQKPVLYVPSTSIVEVDLVFKGAEFRFQQRKEIFGLLSQVIPEQKILPLTLSVMEKAIELDTKAKWASHYFDVIMAAYAISYSAKIVTTDKMIPTLGVRVEW